MDVTEIRCLCRGSRRYRRWHDTCWFGAGFFKTLAIQSGRDMIVCVGFLGGSWKATHFWVIVWTSDLKGRKLHQGKNCYSAPWKNAWFVSRSIDLLVFPWGLHLSGVSHNLWYLLQSISEALFRVNHIQLIVLIVLICLGPDNSQPCFLLSEVCWFDPMVRSSQVHLQKPKMVLNNEANLMTFASKQVIPLAVWLIIFDHLWIWVCSWVFRSSMV